MSGFADIGYIQIVNSHYQQTFLPYSPWRSPFRLSGLESTNSATESTVWNLDVFWYVNEISVSTFCPAHSFLKDGSLSLPSSDERRSSRSLFGLRA